MPIKWHVEMYCDRIQMARSPLLAEAPSSVYIYDRTMASEVFALVFSSQTNMRTMRSQGLL